jgi:hypothetical protein
MHVISAMKIDTSVTRDFHMVAYRGSSPIYQKHAQAWRATPAATERNVQQGRIDLEVSKKILEIRFTGCLGR